LEERGGLFKLCFSEFEIELKQPVFSISWVVKGNPLGHSGMKVVCKCLLPPDNMKLSKKVSQERTK
jgi:hypothetical protein